MKQRLTNIKCISQKGIVLKFPYREFLQLVPNDKRNICILQQRIFEEKKYIITQLKNSTLAKLNFVKINIDKGLYIKKDFFLNKTNKKNSFDFKKSKLIKDSDSSGLNNLFRARLSKNNSSIFTNITKLNNISKFTSNESAISSEKRINNKLKFEPNKMRKKSIFINGFKNCLLNLTKNKINTIKNLYPIINTKMKPSFHSDTEIIEKDFHTDDYVKYLEKNIQYVKTPINLAKKEIGNLNLMTGKKYLSVEADKIINEINKRGKTTRKISIETRLYDGLFLPSVKNHLNIERDSKKNKSVIVKIKK